ncbi:MAG TPA: metalloregulator ArsR/SmtB family transcription factor [Bacteroidales bacterium]|nr:metalloregulator ArsR/SmtB family transcription factor [Bacteroidales bacterium]
MNQLTENSYPNSLPEVNEYEKFSETLKALSHPVRLKIMQLLLSDKICVNEIVKRLDVPQSIISQHLSILRNRGILVRQKKGTRTWYMISDDLAMVITNFLNGRDESRYKLKSY